MIKKHTTLLGIGIFQVIHGLTHLYPLLASVLHTTHIHSPILDSVWVLFGVFSMYIGYKEYKIHKEEDHK